MPIWRSPQCGTPQAETSKCWVCRRSSTACGSCGNFRRSVAGKLGYCGIDRQRRPLRGDEIRSCWEAAPPPIDVPAAGLPGAAKVVGRRGSPPLELLDDRTPVRKLEFVEVPTGAAGRRPATPAGHERRASRDPSGRPDGETAETSPTDEVPMHSVPTEPRWSLWGDAEG